MLPAVGEVVLVQEALTNTEAKVGQAYASGIVAEANAAIVPDAVLTAVDDAAVQVLVRPAERSLKDGVQVGDGTVAANEQAPPDQLEVQRDFGFRSFSGTIYRELAGWLLPIALSTDVGPVTVRVAVNSRRKDANGEQVERTDWFRARTGGGRGDYVVRELRKGSRVLVRGRLEIGEWTTRDAKASSAPRTTSGPTT